jgi:starvation-inducible DNA-binding protein
MEDLIQQMKIVQVNHFAFYLKAHNYHWNVEGPDFKQYHDLFAGIYEEVYGAIDVLAEEIRAADSYAPASFSRFMQLSQISDENNIPPAREMIQRLLSDIDVMQRSIAEAYSLAEQVGLHGYSNIMAERQDAFSKHAWMLRATLKA